MNVPAAERKRYLRDLEFLTDVTRETLSSLRVGQLLWRVVELLRHRFGYDFAAIGLVEGEALVFRAASSAQLEFHEPRYESPWRIPLGTGVVGCVCESGEAHLVNDASADKDFVAIEGFDTKAELTVPLMHREEVIGVLDVQSSQAGAFDDTDLRLLQIVSALVSPAVSTALAFEDERRRSRHLRLVNEVSRLVSSSLNREEVVSLACEAILDALDVSFVGIILLDRTGTRIVHGAHATRLPFVDGLDIDKLSLKLGEGVSSRVITTGEAVLINDVEQDSSYRAVVEGIRSELCVPLRIMGRIIGAIAVEHVEVARFSEEDEALLENLAGFLAQAIDNARLFDSQRRRWLQLLLINEVARVSTVSIDLEKILNLVARQVHDRFGYYAVTVMLCEDQDIVVRALACEGTAALDIGYREPIGKGIAGTVAQTGQTIHVDDPSQFGGSTVVSDEVCSVLCVPLANNEKVIGAIQVQDVTPGRSFDEDDRLVVETLAKSVAGSIANARAIAQAEQLREDLTRMIVHDLRNPVQSVLLTLQEAARLDLPESNLESMGDGIQCAEDILEMINSLLDVARFEAGRARLRPSPAVLNDHVRAVVRRFAPMARTKSIQVTTVLSQDVPVLRLDHELIKRMLGNLVGNALKFTPEGSPVTIRSELIEEGEPSHGVVPPYVLVSVNDKGEGVPVGYHDKIFEKFGQVETRKAGLKMSTGLGLTLCRYVVEAHGGRIWVESEPGEGSTFFVSLPARRRSST